MTKLLYFITYLIWMAVTILFVLSIVGLFMVLKVNNTNYHNYGEQMRTNWMQMGVDIKDAVLR